MTQAPLDNSTGVAGEAEVRPQRPRPAPAQPGANEPPDAWSRNPRRRALVMLLANLGLFVVACMMFSRLTTGYALYVKWPPSTYGAALGQLMLDHINIYQVPAQAAVMALLLAVFVLTPLLIAQFYGRLSAGLFLLPLAILAHLPLLAVALLPAVWLARSHLFGVSNRFVRGLTAMVFPVAALWVSTARTEFNQSAQSPMSQLFLHVPWVAAIVISILALLAFWVFARLLNYRDILAPVLLGVLLATALAVFWAGVGLDELEFRVLDAEYGLDSPSGFRSGPAEEAGSSDAKRQASQFDAKRQAAQDDCASFLRRFPNSRYVPYVYYILGRSQDMRWVKTPDGQISYYSDVPRSQSEKIWYKLEQNYPDHPLAIIARARLAQIRLATSENLSAEEMDAARDLLDQVRQQRQGLRPIAVPRTFLGLAPREPHWEAEVGQQTQALLDWLVLVNENHNNEPADRKVVSRLFALDPHRPDQYRAALEKLAANYTGNLAGNLQVLLALQEPDEARQIAKLREFLASGLARRDVDARYQAMDKLADLLVKQRSDQARREAIELWKELYNSGNKLFAEDAAQTLRTLNVLEALTQPE